MEAATTAAPETTVEETPDEHASDVTRLYHYSKWVHAGAGAEACEERTTGACSDPSHFHAFCRLPNQFQAREIREKALGARARQMRMLRDPSTDVHEILEEEMGRLLKTIDVARDAIVEELMQTEYLTELQGAERDVREGLEEDLDEDGESKWATIDDDRRRLRELAEMDEERRPGDEYETLLRHVNEFGERVEKRYDERVKPQREQLADRDPVDLVDMLRDERISRESAKTFSDEYARWTMFYCTLRTEPDGQRRFGEVGAMDNAAPEVLLALQQIFAELQNAVFVAQGN